jgi:hypothetical protein
MCKKKIAYQSCIKHPPLEEDKLIRLTADTNLEIIFRQKLLQSFSIIIRSKYSSLSEKALNLLVSFLSAHLCKARLLAITSIKINKETDSAYV